MSDKVKIKVLSDGPLIVDNLKKLTDANGSTIEIGEKIALCRCGSSSNKPFCDGTHKKAGFTSKRESTVPLSRETSYEGKEVTIYDNRMICCHAGECVSGLSSVFDVGSKPWIRPDNAAVDQIKEVVEKCPSGALSYSVDNVQVRDFEREAEIKIAQNGPYNVVGGIDINVPEDIQPPSREHYSLCRCGASKNKPYCDGSHSDIGFSDKNN